MAETSTKRLTLLALLFLLPGLGFLAWWSWQSFEDNLSSETHRLRRVEELGAFQVVNTLMSELFHLEFAFSLGIAKVADRQDADWPRALESVVASYRAQARYPDLLGDVVLVADPPVGPRQWISWSSNGWVPGPRPSWIPETIALFDQPADPRVDLEAPFLVFPLPDWKHHRQVLVTRYSVSTVLKVIVPALAREAFAGQGESPGFDVSLVRQTTGPGSSGLPPVDLAVTLVPRVRFSEWLRNYLSQPFDRLPGPLEVYVPGVRWAMTVNLRPEGIAGHAEAVRARNLIWVIGIASLLAVGILLILLSIRRLVHAAQRERSFSALVSHELKTPLAAIRSLSENLADGVVVDTGRVREYGSSLLDQSARLNEMVANILALSVLEVADRAVNQEVFDLSELAWGVGARAGVTVGDAAGPWLARGNRAAVRAAVDNLVTNALRHGHREGERPLVALGLCRRVVWGRRWVGIAVTDHGPGLSRAEIRSLFKPYRRGHLAGERQTRGGGVGLSLVKATMRHLRGRVQVRPVPGGGLTFVLWLQEGGRA